MSGRHSLAKGIFILFFGLAAPWGLDAQTEPEGEVPGEAMPEIKKTRGDEGTTRSGLSSDASAARHTSPEFNIHSRQAGIASRSIN